MDNTKLLEILETNLQISKVIKDIMEDKLNLELHFGRQIDLGSSLLDLINKSERILEELKD